MSDKKRVPLLPSFSSNRIPPGTSLSLISFFDLILKPLASLDPFDGVLREFNKIVSGSISIRLVETKSATMFNEVTLDFKVAIPTKDLENKGLIHQRSLLATRLLKNLLNIKSTEKHGYFLTVTRFKLTGKEKTDESHSCLILFPINFTCRTFTPCVGETMLGVVYKVSNLGVMLRCGPMRLVFLSSRKMAGFRYVLTGEKAAFLNNSLSRIEDGVVVRFRVLNVRWVAKEHRAKREFKVLASLEGDSLGPVSLSGSDELDLL